MALRYTPSGRREGATLLGDVMNYEEKFDQLHHHRIYAREYAGEEPTMILMHGFPDNVHLYDRLVPRLSPPRRIVTFDFLGWGASDKPVGYPYTATNQVLELAAVVQQLQLELNALYLSVVSRSFRECVYEDRGLPVGRAQS